MEGIELKETYTEKAYWEHYYFNTSIDAVRARKIAGEYDQYWDLLVQSCSHQPRTILEIGAYPGRYIAYLSEKYKLKPAALDYNSDFSKIEECFRIFGISDYELIQADFLNHQPHKKYDLVISLGFAEHFENYNNVLDRHCEYLNEGGAMLIMIPNKKYLKEYYSLLVDRDNLKLHNLKIMNLSVFRDFSVRMRLQTVYLGYYGGFNFGTHGKLNIFQKVVQKVFRRTFRILNRWIKNHPNKYFSSTIIAIYKKG